MAITLDDVMVKSMRGTDVSPKFGKRKLERNIKCPFWRESCKTDQCALWIRGDTDYDDSDLEDVDKERRGECSFVRIARNLGNLANITDQK